MDQPLNEITSPVIDDPFEDVEGLASSIRQKLPSDGRIQIEVPSPRDGISCSIFRVPHSIRENKDEAFDPEVISIGPLHYEKRKDKLHAMEEHKWRCLRDILLRSPEGTLELYLVAVKRLEDKARSWYRESDLIELDSDSFVEMMVLDGCFIIEVFSQLLTGGTYHEVQSVWPTVSMDLMKLENQIPFFILQCLFDSDHNVFGPSPPKRFLEIVVKLFLLDSIRSEIFAYSDFQILHLVHLVYICYTHPCEKKNSETGGVEDEPNKKRKTKKGRKLSDIIIKGIPCASSLQGAGMKFSVRDYNNDPDEVWNQLDIQFQDGVIEIPKIFVYNDKNAFDLNNIAVEHCYPGWKKHCTAYILFIKCLIKSKEDVKILSQEGIITNWLGTDEEVVSYFNNMLKEEYFVMGDHYLSGVCEEINQYCTKPWPKMKATLWHDYFTSPWAIASCLAAGVLLLLTLIQTFFAAFPKYAYED